MAIVSRIDDFQNKSRNALWDTKRGKQDFVVVGRSEGEALMKLEFVEEECHRETTVRYLGVTMTGVTRTSK